MYDQAGGPIFTSEYSAYRPGKVLIGHRSIVVVLHSIYQREKWQHRIDFEWDCIDTIYTQSGRLPSLIITTKYAPRMYRNIEQDESNTPFGMRPNKFARKKSRIPCLDTAHSAIIGSCFSWEFVFEPQQSIRAIQNLVEHIPDGPTSMRISLRSMRSLVPFPTALQELSTQISLLQLPFCVNFQAMKIALSGHVPPKLISILLITMSKALKDGKSEEHCAEALRRFDRDLPWPGPHTPSKEYSFSAMSTLLRSLLDESLLDNSAYRAVKRSDTLAMIHRMTITPTGLYLEGPDPEVSATAMRAESHVLTGFI